MTAATVEAGPGPLRTHEELLGHTVSLPAGAPRALLCVIHGMGMTGGYFATHADPGATLTAVGVAAGYAVLVPDRPGYGRSAHRPTVALAEQARAVEHVIEAALAEFGRDLPVVLVGHSLGGQVALKVAAARRVPIAALELAAVGYRIRDGVAPERADRRLEAWGPPSCYPSGTFALVRDVVADVPPGERVADPGWSSHFTALAAAVRCPVRIAWAVHDRWWRLDAAEAAAVAAAFSQAPWTAQSTLLGAGHNLHLGVHARRHNHLTLDFLSDCLSDRLSDRMEETS